MSLTNPYLFWIPVFAGMEVDKSRMQNLFVAGQIQPGPGFFLDNSENLLQRQAPFHGDPAAIFIFRRESRSLT